MLRLTAASENMEIGRQALRCVTAMCPAVASYQGGVAITTTPSDPHRLSGHALNNNEYKVRMLNDILKLLTVSLQSPSSLVQFEAVKGFSSLVLASDERMRGQVQLVSTVTYTNPNSVTETHSLHWSHLSLSPLL